MSLPLLFLALAGAALVGALAAIFSAVRSALRDAAASAPAERAHDLPSQAALVDEKKSLLRAIKDLEYERAVGKISEVDFQRLDRAYRDRAKEVLAALNTDLQPFMAKAESLLGQSSEAKSEARSSDDS